MFLLAGNSKISLTLDISPALESALANITQALKDLSTKGDTIMQEVQDLIAAVARNTTVTGSVVDFVAGLEGRLKDIEAKLAAAGVSPDDLASLVALREQVTANSDKLAAAVVQGTPAEGQPVAPAPVSTAEVTAPAPAEPAAPAPAPDATADAAPADAATTSAPADAASSAAPVDGTPTAA